MTHQLGKRINLLLGLALPPEDEDGGQGPTSEHPSSPMFHATTPAPSLDEPAGGSPFRTPAYPRRRQLWTPSRDSPDDWSA